MTEVVLFSRPQSYRTNSMDVYTNNLFKNIDKSLEFKVKLFRPKDLCLPLVGKYLNLWLYYPYVARRQKTDINHILDHSISHLLCGFACAKTIITCHDLMVLEVPSAAPLWKRKTFYAYLFRNLFKAGKIIAVSQHTKEDILKHSSYHSKNIIVIYYGVDKSIFQELEKEKYRQKFKFDKPTILHVGQANYYKNVEGLIKAMAELNKDIKFVKVGMLSASQLKLLRRLKIDFIHFAYLPQDRLREVYNAVDLLVYPSWHEGFGFPVAEAMSCGCPVVCSNTSSFPEVAGDAAIMVAPDDIGRLAKTIERVFKSQGLRQELIGKGLEQAKKFSWEKTASETVEVYKKIA